MAETVGLHDPFVALRTIGGKVNPFRSQRDKDALEVQAASLREAQSLIEDLRSRLATESARHSAFISSLASEAASSLTLLQAATESLAESTMLDGSLHAVAESARRHARHLARLIEHVGVAHHSDPTHGLVDVAGVVRDGGIAAATYEGELPIYAAGDARRLAAAIERLVDNVSEVSATVSNHGDYVAIRIRSTSEHPAFGVAVARRMLEGSGATLEEHDGLVIRLPGVPVLGTQPRPRWVSGQP